MDSGDLRTGTALLGQEFSILQKKDAVHPSFGDRTLAAIESPRARHLVRTSFRPKSPLILTVKGKRIKQYLPVLEEMPRLGAVLGGMGVIPKLMDTEKPLPVCVAWRDLPRAKLGGGVHTAVCPKLGHVPEQASCLDVPSLICINHEILTAEVSKLNSGGRWSEFVQALPK